MSSISFPDFQIWQPVIIEVHLQYLEHRIVIPNVFMITSIAMNLCMPFQARRTCHAALVLPLTLPVLPYYSLAVPTISNNPGKPILFLLLLLSAFCLLYRIFSSVLYRRSLSLPSFPSLTLLAAYLDIQPNPPLPHIDIITTIFYPFKRKS